MNRPELISAVGKITGYACADVKPVIEATMDVIIEELLRGTDVRLTGFFIFTSMRRSGRTTRNPKTGVTKWSPAYRFPVAKPSVQLKRRMKARTEDPFE